MSKKTLMAATVCVIFALSAVFTIVHAQTTVPKPSVPEFTLKIDNSSIEFIIKNQPLATNTSNSNITLFYQLRVKNHDTEIWAEIHSIDTYHIQSSSEYTTLTIPLYSPPFYPWINYQVLDFQVQAIIGFYSQTYNPNLNNLPNMPKGGYETAFTPIVSSGWSSTQTITIPDASASSTPSPTLTVNPITTPSPSPTKEPSFLGSGLPIGYGYAIIAILVILITGIISLVYFKKTKKQKLDD